MEKKPPRGQRMNVKRRENLEKTAPIQAMKVCGPISLGNKKITSKCLFAIQTIKERYQSQQELIKALRHHLHKDIERLLIARRLNKQREFAKETKQIEKQLNKVIPNTLRQTRQTRSASLEF
jgi:hypothetical protein